MKKILSIMLCFLFIVGCSQGSNDQYKEEAIKTYVEANNRLSDEEVISMDMDGEITVPKSAMVEEAIDAAFDANMIVNTKEFLFKMEFNIESSDLNESVLMYIDREYLYMYMDNEWIKQPLDEGSGVDMDDLDTTTQKISVEEATAFFNSFEEVTYVKENVDGVDGYTIRGKLDAKALMNRYVKEEASAEEQAQANEYMKLLESLDLTYSTFVSNDEDTLPNMQVSINTEVLGTKIDVGPISINLNKTKEKVVIPQAAKNAKENTMMQEV